jgi:hypothetical protein
MHQAFHNPAVRKVSSSQQSIRNCREAYSILIKNRITNLPDRLGIHLDKILANLWDHYGTPDDAAKTEWEAVFDIPRNLSEPILNYL